MLKGYYEFLHDYAKEKLLTPALKVLNMHNHGKTKHLIPVT